MLKFFLKYFKVNLKMNFEENSEKMFNLLESSKRYKEHLSLKNQNLLDKEIIKLENRISVISKITENVNALDVDEELKKNELERFNNELKEIAKAKDIIMDCISEIVNEENANLGLQNSNAHQNAKSLNTEKKKDFFLKANKFFEDNFMFTLSDEKPIDYYLNVNIMYASLFLVLLDINLLQFINFFIGIDYFSVIYVGHAFTLTYGHLKLVESRATKNNMICYRLFLIVFMLAPTLGQFSLLLPSALFMKFIYLKNTTTAKLKKYTPLFKNYDENVVDTKNKREKDILLFLNIFKENTVRLIVN